MKTVLVLLLFVSAWIVHSGSAIADICPDGDTSDGMHPGDYRHGLVPWKIDAANPSKAFKLMANGQGRTIWYICKKVDGPEVTIDRENRVVDFRTQPPPNNGKTPDANISDQLKDGCGYYITTGEGEVQLKAYSNYASSGCAKLVGAF